MNRIKFRTIKSYFAFCLCFIAASIGLFFLFFIMYDVLRHGLSGINLDLFIKDPVPPGQEGGGLRHAFVGHFLITTLATIIGVPIGILGGTYIAEYGRRSKISKTISVLADIMVSVPAIVVGTFVYAILVKPLGHFSGYAGGVALAIIMIPIVLRTTENMLSLVPWSLREAAFALGAPYYRVIIDIVYRGAKTGIFTGVLLAIARVTGEAAPLLFTSFNNSFFSNDMSKPVASLTVTIFQYATGPYEEWHRQAWAASFVILLVILLLTIIGRKLIKGR